MAKAKVIWVEDDEFLNSLITRKLVSEGFDVQAALNGEEGIKLIEKDVPDVVLLDILLPEMNGYDVLEKIKSNPETKDVPVILFSNLASKEDIDKGYNLGASKFLIKSSLVPDEIVGEIEEVLKK